MSIIPLLSKLSFTSFKGLLKKHHEFAIGNKSQFSFLKCIVTIVTRIFGLYYNPNILPGYLVYTKIHFGETEDLVNYKKL